jgi:acyl-CoA hydrolase
VVTLYAKTVRTGRTSVTVYVEVESEQYVGAKVIPVTSATLTMVAVDAQGASIPFTDPPTIREEDAR